MGGIKNVLIVMGERRAAAQPRARAREHACSEQSSALHPRCLPLPARAMHLLTIPLSPHACAAMEAEAAPLIKALGLKQDEPRM